MRGKLHSKFSTASSGRITPADAGKTVKRALRLLSYTDHPRGCGENGTFGQNAPMKEGSPPRMRGKRP